MPVLIPIKEYHTLQEICSIETLSYRQIQIRLKDVLENNNVKSGYLFKKSNKWYIHRTLLKEFKRKRKPIDYKLFITIASKNNFEIDYWKFLIHQLNKKLKKIDASTRLKYVIEPTNRKHLHLHFITTFNKKNIIKSIIDKDLISSSTNDMNRKVMKLTDKSSGLVQKVKKLI
jgi:hypothetical protein